jgi:hypothetical protein
MIRQLWLNPLGGKRPDWAFERAEGFSMRWAHWFFLGLIFTPVAISQLLVFENTANAGIVYGRIYRPDGQIETRGQLVFQNSGQHEAAIENGSYRIFLPEGVYRVQLAGRNCWAEVVSYPRPIRQDIHLECEGGGDHE